MKNENMIMLRLIAGILGALILFSMCSAQDSSEQETCVYWTDGTTTGDGC